METIVDCEFMCSVHQIMDREVLIRRPDNFVQIKDLAHILDTDTKGLLSTRWFENRVKTLGIKHPVEGYHGGRGVSSWLHPTMALECALRYRRAVEGKLTEALSRFRKDEKYITYSINAHIFQGVVPPSHVRMLPIVNQKGNNLISSEIVSKGFGYQRHREFIDNILKHQEYLGAVITAKSKTTTGGNMRKEAFLSEYQICLLPAICKPTEQVKEFQKRLVNSFWALRNMKVLE